MKKLILFIAGLCFMGMVAAQLKPIFPADHRELRVPRPDLLKGDKEIAVKQDNPTVKAMTAFSDPSLMVTVYDMQTNSSNQNRLYLYPDGTMGATAIMSHDIPGWFADRGTGYNYFDGTSWGAQPTARIESSKAGWPSYAPLGATGEIVVSHTYDQGLFIMKSAQKGQGIWTETILPGPAGATDIEWARMVTNGTDHTYVHIICDTYAGYAGMTQALLYYRSLNGGVTWDINGLILPGITNTDYQGIAADTYSWAEPRGNTLCFVVGDSWNDLFIMKSTDNGNNWTKTIIWPCPYNFWNGGTNTGTFWCPDGSSAVALDANGKAHVTFGLMRASGDADGNKYQEPFTDGLLYWNEDMPQLPVDLNPVNLPTANYIGWVQDPAVFTAPSTELAWYYKSLSSFPTMVFDNDDNLYVIWSGVTMFKDPNNYMLRHIFARGKYAASSLFAPYIVDITGDSQYDAEECVYPGASPHTTSDRIPILFQGDHEAGTYLYSMAGAQGQTSGTQNDMIFIQPAMSDILPPATTGVSGDIAGTECYSATETITAAGSGSTFTVENGGSATMISGENIDYLPGCTVHAGGYMLGYIAPMGPYCMTPSMHAVVTGEAEKQGSIEKSSFNIYPNPTTGNFTLALTGKVPVDKVTIDIVGMWGEKVLTGILKGESKHEFSLSDQPAGVYFVRIITGDKSETAKIVKQ